MAQETSNDPNQPKSKGRASVDDVRAQQAEIARSPAASAGAAGTIGPSRARYEGRDKVTGALRYAGDIAAPGMAYAFIVQATVPRGRISAIDSGEARAMPGVLAVHTHETMKGRVAPHGFFGTNKGFASTSVRPLDGPDIHHEGQIIGMVVAETYEAARAAAYRVRYTIDPLPHTNGFGDENVDIRPLAELQKGHESPKAGNAAAAYAGAAHKHEAEYGTPAQAHNPIELYSTTAVWNGGRLTVHEPSAAVQFLRFGLAEQLGLDPSAVHIVSPFVGGSFGSKVTVTPRSALVALAARDLGRPVKLVLTRDQGFTQATHRAETRHDVKLGCDAGGKLAAYDHIGTEVSSKTDLYTVNGVDNSAVMYAFGTVATQVKVLRADRDVPGFMRSPPEVPYMYALECAMDELAEKAGVDPVAFRKMNDTQVSPVDGKPYTSRSLNECFDRAAAAFGWDKRNPAVGSMREGDWLVGYGCATATYPTALVPTAVRVRVAPGPAALVQVSAHDIGTGAYTVAQMTAAQELGLEMEQVRVEMGDSSLPHGPVAGGSNTTASVCNAVAVACARLRGRLGVPAGQPVSAYVNAVTEELVDWAPPGTPPEQAAKLNAVGVPMFAGGTAGDRLRFAFGAEFVEVRVHARTREIRVPRMVGAFAAGRIMNERTARSQLLGGMIWGMGSALHEALEIDPRRAAYLNDNLAEYLIPVNADVPSVEVILVPELDRDTNPLGIKGIGELANVGTAAAVANAVYHATGKRVRELPIRIEKLI